MGKRLELAGRKFGRLTAIRIVGTYEKSGLKMWECRCECGSACVVRAQSLRSGKAQSCGCRAKEQTAARTFKDIAGQKFERWTVIRRAPNKDKCVMWEVQCECGNTGTAKGTALRYGDTKSCGCLSSELSRERFTKHGESYKKGYRLNKTAAYRCAKRNRTPKWADLQAIRAVYDQCPEGMTVDHIIPLQGETVSGLHVANNLQYLTQAENCGKRNKYEAHITVSPQSQQDVSDRKRTDAHIPRGESLQGRSGSDMSVEQAATNRRRDSNSRRCIQATETGGSGQLIQGTLGFA